MDLIDRQAAIDALLRLSGRDTKSELIDLCESSMSDSLGCAGGILDCIGEIEDMPSAQRSFSCGQENDLISRKAAIDQLHQSYNLLDAERRLEDLPSAQSVARDMNVLSKDLISRQAAIDALGERPIVWSNDDEYALGERNQYDIDRLAIETVPSAHSGRNHGHWVHRGCGVFECDQCGKLVSTNVYKIEKVSDSFKFCPECGLDMRGGQE